MKKDDKTDYIEEKGIKSLFSRAVMKFVWTNKFSPQDCSKFFGQRWTDKMI